MIFRPGFPYVRAEASYVHGFARRFWQLSADHRGTEEHPGRVAVLLRAREAGIPVSSAGSIVHGVTYTLPKREFPSILADLDIRERHGYTRTVVDTFSVRGSDVRGRRAIVYYQAEPRTSPAYIGPEEEAVTSAVIAEAEGPSGRNDAYLFKLIEALEAWGLPRDEHLTALDTMVLRRQGGQCRPAPPSSDRGPQQDSVFV